MRLALAKPLAYLFDLLEHVQHRSGHPWLLGNLAFAL